MRMSADASSDPEWLAAKAESEKNGPIVASMSNQILVPTAFSAMRGYGASTPTSFAWGKSRTWSINRSAPDSV